jgi:hypothetical protein
VRQDPRDRRSSTELPRGRSSGGDRLYVAKAVHRLVWRCSPASMQDQSQRSRTPAPPWRKGRHRLSGGRSLVASVPMQIDAPATRLRRPGRRSRPASTANSNCRCATRLVDARLDDQRAGSGAIIRGPSRRR